MPDDFVERTSHMLTTADEGSTLLSATCDGASMMVQVKHGKDPSALVHIARSLLEQAGERIQERVCDEDAPGLPPLFEAIYSAIALLPDPNEDDDEE